MKRINGIYEQICTFEVLHKAYLKARKDKRYRNEVLQFTANLEENLYYLLKDLQNKTYVVGNYKKKYVYEPKKRMILVLPFRDRVVQWAIYLILYPIYDKKFIFDSYGCREEKGPLKAIKRLQSWKQLVERKAAANGEEYFYFKFDISKYFYRVHHKTIIDIFKRTFKDKDLLWLLEILIENEDEPFGLPRGMSIDDCTRDEMLYDVGMPIGSLLSQLIANVYLNDLDQYVKHDLKIRYYIRYMDDMIIILNSKEELHKLKIKIEKFLYENLHLELNDKSCIRPIHQGIAFIGAVVYSTHIRVNKKTALRIKRYLKHLKDSYNKGEATFERINNTVQSYLGLLKNFDAYNLTNKIFNNFVLVKEEKAYEE